MRKEEATVDQSRKLEQALDELRQQADDLDRAGRNLRSILDSMSDGVVVADEQGTFLEFNPAAERILSLGRRNVPPAEWAREYGLFLPDRETVYPTEQLPLLRAMRGKDVNAERMYVRRDSCEGRWISVNARPLRDRKAAIMGGVAVFRDITDLVRSEATIRRLSNAVEETDDLIFMTDREGEITYVNPAFERITGYSRDEVLGKTPRILKSGRHDDGFYKHMWDAILGGDVFRGSIVNRKKNGDHFHAEHTITPIKDERGRVSQFVALVEDMTESCFVALMVVRLDPVRRRLSYCNAGHAAGYVLTGAGDVKAVLGSTNVPLGLFARREYACSEETTLDSGDLLVLLTDGVTESGASDERFFGEERALETVRVHRRESSQAIVQHVYTAARDFAGRRNQHDDMILVVCRLG